MYITRIDLINKIFNYKNINNKIIFDVDDKKIIGKFLEIKNDFNYTDITDMLKQFLNIMKITYPNTEYFINFPGTKNPYLAKAIIETGLTYGTNYRLFFGKNEILDIPTFISSTIDPAISNINNFSCRIDVCDRLSDTVIISQSLKDNFFPKSPFKYYEYDQNGYIIAEYDEKPNNITNIYISNNISDKYIMHTIQRIDDKTLIFRLK